MPTRIERGVFFARLQRDGLHGISRRLHSLESSQDFERSFDHLAGYIALMGHAYVCSGVTADQTVVTHEAEHASEHLVAARSIVTVEQNDFVSFRTIDLAGMTHANEMLRVLASVLIADASLADHERFETFVAQLGKDGCGWDVGVSVGPTSVRRVGKN
ncbi:conserved hypothetical protein [Xanthomonas phaseoli pv. phaseoli]|nr:conserved hypothetical protein [Xanthomonas phaseoli pv. phaseoli]